MRDLACAHDQRAPSASSAPTNSPKQSRGRYASIIVRQANALGLTVRFEPHRSLTSQDDHAVELLVPFILRVSSSAILAEAFGAASAPDAPAQGSRPSARTYSGVRRVEPAVSPTTGSPVRSTRPRRRPGGGGPRRSAPRSSQPARLTPSSSVDERQPYTFTVTRTIGPGDERGVAALRRGKADRDERLPRPNPVTSTSANPGNHRRNRHIIPRHLRPAAPRSSTTSITGQGVPTTTLNGTPRAVGYQQQGHPSPSCRRFDQRPNRTCSRSPVRTPPGSALQSRPR